MLDVIVVSGKAHMCSKLFFKMTWNQVLLGLCDVSDGECDVSAGVDDVIDDGCDMSAKVCDVSDGVCGIMAGSVQCYCLL